MYQFLLNLWVFGRLSEERIDSYTLKGFITEAEALRIKATPREG